MKRITVLIIALMVIIGAFNVSFAGVSDKQLAQQIADKNGAKVEKVITISKGGTKGQVKGTKYTVKYPKKVKKGKKVTVYLVNKNGDYIAMVCLGKVK